MRFCHQINMTKGETFEDEQHEALLCVQCSVTELHRGLAKDGGMAETWGRRERLPRTAGTQGYGATFDYTQCFDSSFLVVPRTPGLKQGHWIAWDRHISTATRPAAFAPQRDRLMRILLNLLMKAGSLELDEIIKAKLEERERSAKKRTK